MTRIVAFIVSFFSLPAFCQLPELVLPLGHSDGILHASFTPNGKYILTASMDHTARVWDAYSGKLLSVLTGHSDYVNRIQSTNDSRLAISASNDNTIKIWTLPEGKLKYDFQCENCFTGVLASDSDSKLLAIATGKGKVKIISLVNGLLIKELQCHNKRVRKILFSPDGKTILTAGYDEKVIKAFNIENGNVIFEITYSEWEPDFYYVNSDKEIVVSGDQGRVYDAQSGQFLRTEEKYRKTQETTEVWSPDKRTYLYFGVPDGSSFINYVSVHDAATGTELRRLNGRVPKITDIQLSPDKKFLVSTHDDKSTRIWSVTNGLLQSVLVEDTVWRPEVWGGTSAFLVDGKNLVTVFYDSCIATIWDVHSKKPVYKTQADEHDFPQNFDLHFTDCVFNEDSSMLLISNWGCVSVIDAKSYKQLFQRSEVHISSAEWTDHGKKIVIRYIGLEPEIWSAENWELLHRFDFEMNDEEGYIENFKVCKDGIHGISLSSSKKVGLWDISTWKLIYSNPANSKLTFVDYNEVFNYIISIDTGNIIQIIDPVSGNYIQSFAGHKGPVYYVDFKKDGSEMISFSEESKEAILWNVASGKMISTFSPSEKPYNFFCFNDKYFAHNGLEILCYEKKHNGIRFRMAAVDESGFVCLLSNGKYRCSREALKHLSWKMNNKIYGFDQWDMMYNRPDEVMKFLGSSDSLLIKAYYQAFLKRLLKANADTAELYIGSNYPEIQLLNADSISGISKDSVIYIEIQAIDNSTNGYLKNIVVMVNNCPIFDQNNRMSFTGKQKDGKIKVPINLSYGQNIVEIFCINSLNISSLKHRIITDYLPKTKPPSAKYLIAISVSDYKDARHNLKYAVKDGRDMATLFAGKDFSIDTLFNQNATRENIIALKQKLMQTKVDDEVILYVSGHGLLDKNFDFYFATYDMNFENPAEYGILYDDLEGLLDGIPARKKLLLMDACHSGEVDKDEVEVKDAVADLGNNKKGDIKAFGYKGTIVEAEGSGLGLQNSFELMQELFANLSRGSGAIVISAAAGTGYALESPEWNNGVFTYCILNGLKNLAADANGDKTVTVSELKDYVSKEVERLTNGAQKPTSRKESLEFDWGVW